MEIPWGKFWFFSLASRFPPRDIVLHDSGHFPLSVPPQCLLSGGKVPHVRWPCRTIGGVTKLSPHKAPPPSVCTKDK